MSKQAEWTDKIDWLRYDGLNGITNTIPLYEADQSQMALSGVIVKGYGCRVLERNYGGTDTTLGEEWHVSSSRNDMLSVLIENFEFDLSSEDMTPSEHAQHYEMLNELYGNSEA